MWRFFIDLNSPEEGVLSFFFLTEDEASVNLTAVGKRLIGNINNIISFEDKDNFVDLPSDSSVEHDHYIYGTPKENDK